jgi:predicted nucleic acid-binding protein
MRVLLDTSVLVAAMVQAHPLHARCILPLQRVKRGEDIGLVAAHSLAEMYAVLTALPVHPRISTAAVQQLMRANILDAFQIVSLDQGDYLAIIDHLTALQITGGAIYDALIVFAALKSKADQILTLNDIDFRRLWPESADRVSAP